MLKAVLRKGTIVPLEPLPSEWEEGANLEVAKTNEAPIDVDAWAKFMTQLCADSSAEEEERMHAGIDEHRRQAKQRARREMGLLE